MHGDNPNMTQIELMIKPHEGVGPILFGMPMAEVRATIRSPYREFKRTPSSTTLTDSFGELGMFVCYSQDNLCEGIEMGLRACPTLFGRKIIGQPYREIRDWLKIHDSDLLSDGCGCRSLHLSIGIFAPNAKSNEDGPIEGIGAFQSAYFERVKRSA
jgi:hypothetical protein